MFLFQVHDTHFFRLGTGWLVYLEVQNAHVPGSSFRQKKKYEALLKKLQTHCLLRGQ